MTEQFEQEVQGSSEGVTTPEIVAEERAALVDIQHEAESAGFTELAMTAQLAEILTQAAVHSVNPQENVDLPTPDEVAERLADAKYKFGQTA